MQMFIFVIVFIANLIPNLAFGDSKFDPAIIVNESIISKFEVSQRIILLDILQTTGDVNKKAKDELIYAKLIERFVKKYNLSIADSKIEEGVIELANRFNLDKKNFLSEIDKIGLSEKSLEIFLRDKILLKEVVQYKFSNRAEIAEDEIDAYIINGSASLDVELSEIVLPFNFDTKNETYNLALILRDKLSEGVSFGSIAKKYSQSPSATSGGDIGWMSIDKLSSEMANVLLTTEINSIIGPHVYDNVIVLFKLTDVQEVPLFKNMGVNLDFLELLYPIESELDPQTTALIFENNNNCLNLKYELSKHEILNSKIKRFSQEQESIVDNEKYNVLINLDAGESSFYKNKNDNLVFLMLCSRKQKISENDRYKVKQYLFSQRLTSLANGFMEDLKAEAKIIYQ